MAEAKNSIRVVMDTPSLRERTTRVLRDAILRLHFKPGQKLVERRLCEETGVSRSCVREALRHLESEGLVVRTANRGMFVAEVGADEAREIYEVRAALESAMGRYFVERASDRHVAALEAALQRIEKTIFGKDVLAYAFALDNFSDALMDGAGNEQARRLLNMLRARITYLRTITARAASVEQKNGTLGALNKIVDALKQRDADAAEEHCRAYVHRSASFALQLLKAHESEAAET